VAVAVNLSIRQLPDPELARQIQQQQLADCGLQEGSLELEVTEADVMASQDTATESLRRLASLGASVTLDDFGIGRSALRYLKRLPIQCLKLESSFLRDVDTAPESSGLVAALIGLGHRLACAWARKASRLRKQRQLLEAHDGQGVQPSAARAAQRGAARAAVARSACVRTRARLASAGQPLSDG
jgi:EAL domain-containing protein (putative c-di-GMP-specific phosphodiesterase class I)